MYFYEGKPVTNTRFYSVAGRSLVEFTQADGTKRIVDGHKLTTERPKDSLSDVYSDVDRTEIFKEDKVEKEELTTSEVKKAEVEKVEIEPKKDDVADSDFSPFKLSDKDGDVIEINSQEDLDAAYELYGLTEEGITGLLEKTQKSHKGYRITE